jgi:dihydrofolate synthase/folylpolyglutamate synthase
MTAKLDDWLAKLEHRHFRAIDLGLERCGQVFRNMGSPRPASKIFSIAGTNGKGSVAAYISSILDVSGFKYGTYTSPHILRFNERISIGGRAVSNSDIVRAFEVVEAALNGVSLTYFEFTTLAAFHVMHGAGLDSAVLEVGLGGRLDAVNLVDADCAVITPIGLDHQDYLGPDREAIGFEKAGIMRTGRPVVCGDPDPPQSVCAQASKISATLLRTGVDFEMKPGPGRLEFSMGDHRMVLEHPPLAGRHQAANLGVALAALGQVFPAVFEDSSLLHRGIAATRMSGRLQRLDSDRRVLLDVGHNPMAASVVAEYLAGAAPGRVLCVIAMLADKDVEGVAAELVHEVDDWLCAGLAGSRGQDGAALCARIGSQLAGVEPRSFDTVAAALASALAEAAPGDTILVFGSFETVAAALRHMDDDSVHGRALLIES